MLETLSEKQLVQMVQESNDAYYNKNSLLTDNQFDIIKNYFASYLLSCSFKIYDLK